jgi:diaminopimelate epimerase
MCGNGGRCLTKFAFDCGIIKEQYTFIASDGLHEASFGKNKWVHLKMIDVNTVQQNNADFVLNTGSPHYIKSVQHIDQIDVLEAGRAIRYNDTFKEKGINVNFVEVFPEEIKVRTYERGVEDETYSCGTGVTAASLIFAKQVGFNRIAVDTKGGQLAVEFNKINDQYFNNIWLCGPATFVFKGDIEV